MIKKVLSFILLFVLALQMPLSVFAHSELESAQPSEGEKVTTDLEVVNLTFSTKIEDLSTMKLKNGSKEIPLQISIEDNQMTGKMEKPLENGSYTVEYRIIGADSHVIEGNYTFSLERPKQNETQHKPAEKAGKQETKKEKTEHHHENKTNNPSYFAPLTILLVLLIAVGSFFAFRKRS
ncbi:copper resistance CopC family protein [Fictibacillus barbaricus]|uniref:Methionine-rich copper-binding protein CopC n=1 Tax=Fictibacillus barbaricus TaxID=182136 RepID=A0ABU1TXC3_9BACL|nr:copper resistance protein CopC [Fictibacillus barbaricus]MDR7071872.1 methionine-rich copper-binding protein CopC [Fictibacillus barbaricus]